VIESEGLFGSGPFYCRSCGWACLVLGLFDLGFAWFRVCLV